VLPKCYARLGGKAGQGREGKGGFHCHHSYREYVSAKIVYVVVV